MTRTLTTLAAALLAATSLGGAASAQEIKFGVTGTFTGPNAPVGVPYRMATEVFPTEVAGVKVRWIVLDDGGDTTTAVKNARKLIDEDKVDALVGSTSTPTSTALFDVMNEAETVQISGAPVRIPDDKKAWIFNMPQPVPLMVDVLVKDMVAKGIKNVGFIGYSDGWGDLNVNALKSVGEKAGIKVVAEERFNRPDPSVTAQVLKVISANPDAVFIGATVTPATLPHLTLRDQGFTKQIYHTHGIISPAFLKAGGKTVEGSLLPAGPVVVAAELPDSNPIKKVAAEFKAAMEAKHGPGSANAFAAHMWDSMLVLYAAVPEALKKGKPRTQEFRTALRDAMQSGKEVVANHGIYKFTADDRYGLDERARVLAVVKDGGFRLAK